MKTKETPGLGAGVKGNTPHEGEANATAAVPGASVGECPPGLTSQRFPGRREAIKRASDRAAALRAVAAFASGGMFVRHVAGTYNHLSRDAVANEAWQYVRLSRAAKEVSAIEVAAIVAYADDMVREKYAR